MEDDPLWKKTSKIKTWNISATIGPILLKFEMLAYRTKLNVNIGLIFLKFEM